MKTLNCMFVMLAAMLLPQAATGTNDTYYGFDDGSFDQAWWGTGLKEGYDVAILVENPTFVGSEIVGIRVDVPQTEDVAAYSGWLTSALQLDGKTNVADIASKEGSASDGVLEIMFDTPYVLTEDGVYVGYSFQVEKSSSNAAKYPVCVARTVNPDGLYIHSTRSYLKWTPISEEIECVSSLQLIIRGDFTNNSLQAVSLSEINVKAGEKASAILTVINSGVNAVTSIGYTLKVGESTSTNICDLEQVIPAQYGASAKVSLEMPVLPTVGIYPVELTLTDVNGEPNNDPAQTVKSEYYSLSSIPKHNAYMEEFTGTWCTFCPVGYVAMELMNERHEDFIGVAYHCGDVMSMQKQSNIPDPGIGYPMAALDRKITCSPYFGLEEEGLSFGIEPLWQSFCDEFTPFDIAITADFTDESWEEIRVDATVTSVKPLRDKEYRVEYVLIEDGLTGTGSSWYQTNGYAGDESVRGMEGMDMFIDNKNTVKGLLFNDVALLNTGNLGVEGSLPATIEADQEYTASYTFTLTNAKNSAGKDMIQDKTKLRVAALVVYNDGSQFGVVMNAAKCGLTSLASVETLPEENESEVVATVWYDLAGRQVVNPLKGLYIKVEHLADGSAKSYKVVK